MTDDQLRAYATGQGWDAQVVHVVEGSEAEHAAFHEVFQEALDATSRGSRVAVFLRCTKGWGGPESVEGRRILGTPRAHKTPLSAPGSVAGQLELLERWLARYAPHELFDPDGRRRAHWLVRWRRPGGADYARSTPNTGLPTADRGSVTEASARLPAP